MNQKGIIILFFILATAGIIAAGFSQFKEGIKVNSSASPSPSELKLDLTAKQNQQNAQGTQSQQTKRFDRFPGIYEATSLKDKAAVIETNKGRIVFEIFPDSPKAASNFIFLTLNNFYNGLKFHRVEPGFVIQGGDPQGNGTGGPGYQFEDEPVTMDYNKGIVAMANSGPNTNGSQFFIMLEDNPSLPKNYTIFGRVVEGMEVVQNIKVGDVMQKVTITTRASTTTQATSSAIAQ